MTRKYLKRDIPKLKQKLHNCLGCGKKIRGWLCEKCRSRNNAQDIGFGRYELHTDDITEK